MPEPARIRERLAEAIAAERKDSLRFSILTVVLTPAFAVLSAIVLLIAVHQLSRDTADPDLLWDDGKLVHATTLFLAFSAAAFFIRPSGQPRMGWGDFLWLGAGLAMLAVLLVLTYGSPMRLEHPRAFWGLYGTLSILMLGMIGRGYVPRDDYYMRSGEWSFAESPADRFERETDFWLGFAVGFPRLILGSYGDLFGSLWLWRGLDDRGLRLAADVLHALGSRDPRGAQERLGSAPPAVSGRVLRWLLRLKFIRRADGAMGLSSEGERLLGVSEWTVV